MDCGLAVRVGLMIWLGRALPRRDTFQISVKDSATKVDQGVVIFFFFLWFAYDDLRCNNERMGEMSDERDWQSRQHGGIVHIRVRFCYECAHGVEWCRLDRWEGVIIITRWKT